MGSGDDGKVRRDQYNIMRNKKKKVVGSRVVFNHSPAIGEGELKLSSRYWSLLFGLKVLMT